MMICAFFQSPQVDPSAHLHNIRNLQLYSYQYQHSTAKRMCCEPVKRHDGFIAQQVREVLPEAVKEVVSVGYRCVCRSGCVGSVSVWVSVWWGVGSVCVCGCVASV